MGPKFAIIFSGIEESAVAGFMEQVKEEIEGIEIEPVDVEFEDAVIKGDYDFSITVVNIIPHLRDSYR